MSNRAFHAAATLAALAALALGGAACHSPAQSQRYFAAAAAEDPRLELLHETALYAVYYDHALRRCVLHSAYTWGEGGGGGGGAGIGVALFPCDPARIRARSDEVDALIRSGRAPLLPVAQPAEGAPAPAGGGTPAPAKGPSESYPGSGS